MAAAFDSGTFPEPLPLPRGRPQDQAAALAKKFTDANESSLAALYAATLAAGYTVRKPDGTLAQPEHSQGLGFEWWEISALAKLHGRGYGVTLGHLSETLKRAFPQLKEAPLVEEFRTGLEDALGSEHQGLRFWARFIIDLGHTAEQPYELLRPGDVSGVRLNPVQVAFLMTRLAGEVGAAGLKPPPSKVGSQGLQRRFEPLDFFLPVVAAQGRPCGFSEELSVVADYFALTSTSVLGVVVGHFTDVLGGRLGAANLISTLVKFILSYALLDVSITMDAEELIRTKDFDPGDYRRLTATVKIDTGKADYINCLRPLMNLSGVDVEIPENGPVADARIVWRVIQGGDFVGGSGSRRWVDHGIFYIEALEGQPDAPAPDRSPANQFTDEDGNSTIYAVGAPQESDLTKRRTTEVEKGAGVQVDVQLKGRVKGAAGLAAALSSVFGSAISFLTLDPAGGTVGLLTEMAYRSSWYTSEPFYFPVIDWEPCGNLWSGTIVYSAEFGDKGDGVGANNLSVWDESRKYTATVNVAPVPNQANNARVAASASQENFRFGKGLRGCYRITTQLHKLNGTTQQETNVTVGIGGGRYSVGFALPVVPATGTVRDVERRRRPVQQSVQQAGTPERCTRGGPQRRTGNRHFR